MKTAKIRDPYKTTRVAYIGEAGFEYLISLFVTTDLLVYILNEFVTSQALQGIIANIVNFAFVAQIGAFFFAGKRVKKVVTVSHIVNQTCFVLLYFLPLLPLSNGIKTALFIIFLVLGHFINNLINSPKINWLMQSVPDKSRGRFTAVKEIISLVSGMALSFGLGVLARTMEEKGELRIYYLICGGALILLTLLHTATLLVSHEDPPKEPSVKGSPFLAFKELFAVPSVMRVLGVVVLWNLAIGFSFPFFASYKQQDLAFSMDQIMLITVAASACRVLASPLLGKFADKFSFSKSVTLGFLIAAVAYFINLFTLPSTRWLFLVFLCLYYIGMASINSGFINLVFDFVPAKHRQTALGVQQAMSGIAAFLASLVGGGIVGAFQGKEFQLFGMRIYPQQVLTLITLVFILGILLYMKKAIFPLQKKKEEENNL